MTKRKKKKAKKSKADFCVPIPISESMTSYRLMYMKPNFRRCKIPVGAKLQKIMTSSTGYAMYLNQN